MMKRIGKTTFGASNETNQTPQVVVLIASGFDEQSAALVMSQIRRSGHRVAMVSTTAGLIRGEHGLAVRPDYSLESLPENAGIHLVGIPGSKRSALALLTDPRVHRLFEDVLSHGGRLFILAEAESAFASAGQLDLMGHQNCWLQGEQRIESFTSRILDYLAAWQPAQN
jgi:putative intracellular protease/amidase